MGIILSLLITAITIFVAVMIWEYGLDESGTLGDVLLLVMLIFIVAVGSLVLLN